MNRRIEGTFADVKNLKATINGLLREGYVPRQILVLTRNKEGAHLIEEKTGIEVVITNGHEETLWDRIVSFFMVATDEDDDEEEELFEDYGINEETYERFEDALEDGEYLLLIDDAPPIKQEYSNFMVRDGILPEEDETMNKENDDVKKSVRPDWADDSEDVKGDVGRHTVEAEKNHDQAPTDAEENPDLTDDVTGEPIVAEDPEGDPTMADENQKMDEMQVDRETAHSPEDDDDARKSRDPFGGETVAVNEDEDNEEVEPEYDETDKDLPAL